MGILAHFWTLKAFLPAMISRKDGHIVNVASLAGHSGTNKLVDYCSSKFAAVGLDESLRVELFVQGHSEYIKTTVVCPYYISTGMFAGVQVGRGRVMRQQLSVIAEQTNPNPGASLCCGSSRPSCFAR